MAGPRMLKAAAVLFILGYCSLLAYQVTFKFQESFFVEPVTKTAVLDNVQENVTLQDVFISVKTSRHFQFTRLPIILKTWFQLAKHQTWFFTDIDNPQHQNQTHGHMVNTNCAASHQRKDLCCKTAVEYDTFLDSHKKWWCHFDDDNYVNVPRLVVMLQQYDHLKDWYLGKISVYKPISTGAFMPMSRFWFATFGAGVCISRSLAFKMMPLASGGRFSSVCEKIKFPDDVTMGYIIQHLLKTKLTVVPEFHSHLEPLKLLRLDSLRDQITFGYTKLKSKKEWNTVDVPGFDESFDPTRLLSLHCFLFPDFEFCPR